MKFLNVYKSLLGSLEKGELKPGDMLPSSEALERKFEVSRTVVNNALSLLVRNGTIKRVRSQGTFVLSRPGVSILETTRSLRVVLLGKGTLVGFMNDDFSRKAALGINEVFRKTDRSLHFIALRRIESPEALALLEGLRPSGVLLFAVYDKAIIKGLKERRLPVVCLDTVDQGIPFTQYTSDHQQGATLAVRKLHELGHRKILFLGGRKEWGGNDPDHEYWAHAIRAETAVLRLPEARCEFVATYRQSLILKETESALRANPGRTGIICASHTLFSALRTLVEKNRDSDLYRSVDAVLFTHYKDREFLAGRPVWQVRWNMQEMGKLAAGQLLSLIKGDPSKPAIHRMPVELY